MNQVIRVLVIDDDEVDRKAVRRALASAGMQAEVCEEISVAAGIAAVGRGGFDCVILDYNLPDGTGMDFLRTQAHDPNRPYAIILMTGMDDEETGLAALQAGAEDYVVKGKVDAAALKRSIRYAMERHRLQNQAEQHTKRLAKMASDLSVANEKLAALATTDGLTGIANHRRLQERMTQHFAEARRGRGFVFVLADVDHFKELNDFHGHQAGDEALVAIAQALVQNVREIDLVARYGGEEFGILLLDADEAAAAATTERLRAAVANIGHLKRPVTMSFGLCTYRDDFETPAAMIDAADRALYSAKKGGRDRIVRSSELTG